MGELFRHFFPEGSLARKQFHAPGKIRAQRSGFIIDPDGYVVTNSHVVDGSEQARVGGWVFAAGDPFGLRDSVSAGIVSARDRKIHYGPHDDHIQIDAPINRGNSGGPLFDASGAKAAMAIVRDGTEKSLELVIGQMPAEETVAATPVPDTEPVGPRLGFLLDPVTLEVRQAQGPGDDAQDVLVAGSSRASVHRRRVSSPAA